MNTIGQPERATQNRVVKLFQDKLHYRYLDNWHDRKDNSNIEPALLTAFLQQNYSDNLITKALHQLNQAASSQSLYEANKAIYSLLRYGVNVQPETGHQKETVHLIDWRNPLKNDFALAEEVSITGAHDKRPDLVLYVNGIALAVLELKRSTVSVTEGIRQNLDNQKAEFIGPFFTTVQFALAGNDSEGLVYGAIDTKENYYLHWKEVCEELNPEDRHLLRLTQPIRELAADTDTRLDKNIIELLNKERFLELIHDFIVFDRGVKKMPRPNQYFGVKAAQEQVRKRQGGIIWHTQGSGKSLTMVWLTKWILENISSARVLIITDRTELDEQIEKVYNGVEEDIHRTKSGADLLQQLNIPFPRLLCSLVHKFGRKEEVSAKDVDSYINDLKKGLPSDFSPKGDLYVFVDECHRTQSDKLHQGMKAILPDALFIGFTGTPLLKKDKRSSLEVFGPYIHTYTFDEAVKDKVVLDLRYEARDVEQKLGSRKNIDAWFDSKTKGLNDLAKAELKKRWGTLEKVFSSKSRLEKIVLDIMLDMERKERLHNGRGNALLVADSVYNACRYYELFQNAGFSRCAIITSYVPSVADIKGETTGEGKTEEQRKYDIYTKMLAGKDIQTFERDIKKQFIEEPARMKLLIVVDKLLTGFDAPPATYLYIDKNMQDHGLFQAVCRVNRLHGEDKEYGFIVDYKDLFQSLNKSVTDYTSGAFAEYDNDDVAGLLQNRLKKGRERLDDALETVRALLESVEPPKGQLQMQHYFVGKSEDFKAIKETEPRRVALYKAVVGLIRAYANLANEMPEAGYSPAETEAIKAEVKQHECLRKEIQLASGDYIELKRYEPAMRHLIDNYIGAEESRLLAGFDDLGLVELMVEQGEKAFDKLPPNVRKNKEAMAEVIENNLRKVIIEEHPTNPKYYEKMSVLLDELIKSRKKKTAEYKKYLQQQLELARQVLQPGGSYPNPINTPAKRALYDSVGSNKDLALDLDREIFATRRDGWRNNTMKTREVRNAIQDVLNNFEAAEPEADYLVNIAKNQQEY
ncbi:type I restriction enzyme, R subunit [Candidatus Electrothrix marina]|uniref:Type I restriction enzyme endonuclease subunit n=1 Tax=Candidatus Electrothrix marina TaxID=1859130 RepID=A0A444JGK7_9BACT|nr:type I restriction enzyme, R subunit [Candidatus Electrothrix marina]